MMMVSKLSECGVQNCVGADKVKGLLIVMSLIVYAL